MDVVDENASKMLHTEKASSVETSIRRDNVETSPIEEVLEKSIQFDTVAPVDINGITEMQPHDEETLLEDGSSSADMFKGEDTNKNVDKDNLSIPRDFNDDKNGKVYLLDEAECVIGDNCAVNSSFVDNKDKGKTVDVDQTKTFRKESYDLAITGKELENVKATNDKFTGSITDSASEDENTSQTVYDMEINDSNITDNLLENGEENGIVINEKDIVTATNMYGRGKRSKHERKSTDILSHDEDKEEENSISLRSMRGEQNYAKNPYSRSPNKRKYSSPGRKPKTSRKLLTRTFDEEKVLLPLKEGWRREVVIRNVFDKVTTAGGVKQTPADVYYHPPKGRKLRSMKEIIDYLKKTGSLFTEDNFSLLRRPISEPPYEVVRHAGKSKGRSSSLKDEDSSFNASFDQPEVVIERAEDDGEESNEEVKREKLLTSTPVSSILKRAKIKVTPMRSTFKFQSRGRPAKSKPPPHFPKTKNLLYRHSSRHGYHGVTETLIKDVTVTIPDLSRQDSDSDDSSITESPPAKRFKATARKSTTQKYLKPSAHNSSQQAEALCTLSCPGQENIPPSLQCVACLCLFHPHCVAYTPSRNSDFTCLRCYDPSQLQPRTKTITLMRVAPSAQTSVKAPLIKQEPLDPEHRQNNMITQSTSVTPKDINSTLLEHLRTSILERQIISTIGGRTVSILSPVQPSQAAIVGPRQNASPSSTVESPSSQNLPNLSILSDSVRRPTLQRTIYMTPSGMVSHSTVTSQSRPTTVLVPGASLIGSIAQGEGTTLQLPPLVAPVPQMQYVSPTPTTPSLRTPVLSMMPPRLITTPKTPPIMIVDSNKTSPISSHLTNGTTAQDVNGKTGQILTLPSAVAKRLNLQQPLALKINNVQITVPPSSFLFTSDGLKLFLPPKTFPLQLGRLPS